MKFSIKLERIEGGAFYSCASLERITIPLKDGIVTSDDIFAECDNLKHVDHVEGVHEVVASLLMEGWRNDMNDEIDSIKQILPNTPAGDGWDEDEWDEDVGKAQVIRTWIRSVLRKIVHYQAEHDRLLNEAAATLQIALPQDIAMSNVLPFLELPSNTFKAEDLEEDETESSDDDTETSNNYHKEKGISRYSFYSFVGLLLVVLFSFVRGVSFPSGGKNGRKNGYGKYTWEDGSFYEGEFQDGRRNGRGKLTLAKGDFYDGEFKDDAMLGYGKYTLANGNVYDGDFQYGKVRRTEAAGNIKRRKRFAKNAKLVHV